MIEWLTLDVARLVVRVIGVLALLLTVLLGFLGITKEYKDDEGKVTRWGRYAAGAVLFSGALSLFSTLLQSGVTAEESEQQRARQDKQFEAQLTEMRTLSADMEEMLNGISEVAAATETVQSGVQSSLEAQDDLLDRSERGLNMSARLARQEHRNSQAVLQRVWEDSNQVRPGDLSLSVTYQCPRSPEGTIPTILPVDARASVILTLPASAAARDKWIVLHSARQDLAVSERPVPIGILFQQTSHFSPLLGDLGALRNAAAWRGVQVRVSITGQQKEVIRPDNVVPKGWATIKCDVKLLMLVGGRRAAFVEGALRQAVRNGRAQINVRFPDTTILPSAIPTLPGREG